MHRQFGDLEIDEQGVAQRGLLVRHLVLPNRLAGTKEVVRFLARESETGRELWARISRNEPTSSESPPPREKPSRPILAWRADRLRWPSVARSIGCSAK